MTILGIVEFVAAGIIPTAISDFPITVPCAIGPDDDNKGVTVAFFDDTTEQGGATEPFCPPAGSTNVDIEFTVGARTAPGAQVTNEAFHWRQRQLVDAAPEAWSAPVDLADMVIETDKFLRQRSANYTMAALGLTAGKDHQACFSRETGNGLAGINLKLAKIRMVFKDDS